MLSIKRPTLWLGVLLMAPALHSDTLSESFTNAKVDGYVRGFYFNVQPQPEDESTFYSTNIGGIGGKLALETAPIYDLSVGAAMYYSQAIGYDAQKDGNNESLTNPEGQGFAVLGQAYVKYATKDLTAVIGRQQVNTPMINPDDVRIVPDLYNGYTLTYTGLSKTMVTAAYLTQMMGPIDSVAPNPTVFASMSVAAVSPTYEGQPVSDQELIGNHGMGYIGVQNNSLEGTTLDAWYYYSNDFVEILYLEGAYTNDTLGLPLTGGVQYSYYESVGSINAAFQNANNVTEKFISYDVYGAMAEAEVQDVTLSFAYNDLTKHGETSRTLLGAWGGLSEYVGANEFYFSNMQNAGLFKTSIQGMEFDAVYQPTKTTNFTASYIYFNSDQQNSNVQVIDLIADWNCKYVKNLNWMVLFEQVHQFGTYQSAYGPVNVGNNFFKIRAQYSF